ncbi:hypothetical protein [Streptomyces sp. BBFR102]|uniref:hypothetical protein n=1 Tax=Streptomyces sp. BBFR102 TaxID=3448171 RepID=UPI003F53D9CD
MTSDDDLAFALQIAGAELATEPAPPDSPLGLLRLFAAANPGLELGPEHIRDAIAGTLPKI